MPFSFGGTWRRTFISFFVTSNADLEPLDMPPFEPTPLLSDVLFQAWRNAVGTLDSSWLSIETIDRRENLSVKEFVAR